MDYDTLAFAYQRNRTASSAVVAELRATAGIGPDSEVLEVGCGTGNHLIALQRETGCRAQGLDRSTAMLDHAHAHAHARADKGAVSLRQGAAERLDCADCSLDLIYSVDVIHHLDDRAAYFTEAYRCLRNGGRIATFTHSHEMIARGGGILRRYFPETVAADLARYPAIETLRQAMADGGLEDLDERVVSHPMTLSDSRPYEDKAFSGLHLIAEEAFERGLRALKADLATGPISATRRHLVLWGRKRSETT